MLDVEFLGTKIADSDMGVTVFDLFNEVLSQSDLESFLHSHGINYGDYRGHGLILRSFLLLVDLSKNGLLVTSNPEKDKNDYQVAEVAEVDVKVEFVEESNDHGYGITDCLPALTNQDGVYFRPDRSGLGDLSFLVFNFKLTFLLALKQRPAETISRVLSYLSD